MFSEKCSFSALLNAKKWYLQNCCVHVFPYTPNCTILYRSFQTYSFSQNIYTRNYFETYSVSTPFMTRNPLRYVFNLYSKTHFGFNDLDKYSCKMIPCVVYCVICSPQNFFRLLLIIVECYCWRNFFQPVCSGRYWSELHDLLLKIKL